MLGSLLTLECVAARHVPIVVLANKSDLPEALTPTEVAARLNVAPATVLALSATTGRGLPEAIAHIKVRGLPAGAWGPVARSLQAS